MTSPSTSIDVKAQFVQTNRQKTTSMCETPTLKKRPRTGTWIAGLLAGTSAATAITFLFTKVALWLSAGLLTLFSATMAAGQQASMANAQPSRPDATIVQAAETYRQAVLNRDVDTVMSLFRDDAVEMPPFQPPVAGRDAIRQFYQASFSGPVKVTAFTFSRRELTVQGDIAYDVGTFKRSMTTPTGPVESSGPYVVILKHTNGKWGLAYLIYNCDCAPPPPAQPPHTQASR